jgi:GDPmannose 4,6-dehydratase
VTTSSPQAAIVTGVAGQDGYFLTRELLHEGMVVHGVARRPIDVTAMLDSAGHGSQFVEHRLDVLDEEAISELVASVQPREIYNLAGQSSVAASFESPLETWRSNADGITILLEAVRRYAPDAKVYQASSGEMFGWEPGGRSMHTEASEMHPNSPYAAAKYAAHTLCGVYRQAHGLRIGCGIAFNHESHRRSGAFLTRKVIDHVKSVSGKDESNRELLRVGNLAAERDWGFAPEYVQGMVAILRQIELRAAHGLGRDDDVAANYRDYILATGRVHAVWELINRAFLLVGIELDWDRTSVDPRDWSARYASGRLAVVSDPALIRPADPITIEADPSMARRELGWKTDSTLDTFLQDMLVNG